MLRHGESVLVTLAILGPDGRPTWHGIWLSGGAARPIGPTVSPSALASRAGASETGATLVDLLAAASLSLLERLEELGSRLDAMEAAAGAAPLEELASVERGLASVRKHLFRFELLLAELDGPLGQRFGGAAPAVAEISAGFSRSVQLAVGLQQTARDLLGLRTAAEANRLAATANQLGRTSNQIAALANSSNVRMLGVAYVALALALVSAVVLIPNTAATILGMPSAAWVPGLWVDVILVVLAVVPVAFVFTRPWVRHLLAGWGSYERASAEGLADLPEVSPEAARAAGDAERLNRRPP